jgi:hypothetical protein
MSSLVDICSSCVILISITGRMLGHIFIVHTLGWKGPRCCSGHWKCYKGMVDGIGDCIGVVIDALDTLAKWVHSSVVRAADCRSADPWFKSGCALF